MNKRWYRRFLLMAFVLISILGSGFNIDKLQAKIQEEQVSTSSVSNQTVILGGMPIGIYMETDGVLVLGTDGIVGKDGVEYEPAGKLVKSGDYIIAINGTSVISKKQLQKYVDNLNSKQVSLEVRRNGKNVQLKMDAVETQDGKYKLGIWVRDNVQGLGTVTYMTEDGHFGALGHGIYDSDTNELVEMADGRVYETTILRIQKGERGVPGGMEGLIVYNKVNHIGVIEKNSSIGVYGTLKDVDKFVGTAETIPVCAKSDVKLGPAKVRCTIDGKLQEYDIEIKRFNPFSLEANKGFVIEITDKELLDITGGIVQGMSGSPILQNGKLVGAVTHVLVNDPTRGYGIFIEEMME